MKIAGSAKDICDIGSLTETVFVLSRGLSASWTAMTFGEEVKKNHVTLRPFLLMLLLHHVAEAEKCLLHLFEDWRLHADSLRL